MMLIRAMVLLVSIATLWLLGPPGLSAQDTDDPLAGYTPSWREQLRVRQLGDSTYYTINPSLGTPLSTYDPRVNRYSPDGALNPYTSDGGRLYGQDGAYLGRLNANRYDPESVSNPHGIHGSPYSPTSTNNPYSIYGSPYSVQSPNNPYTLTPPIVLYGDEEQ